MRRLAAAAAVAIATGAVLIVPQTASGATLDVRPAPIAFVGAGPGSVCPSPVQASGEAVLAPLARLTASRGTASAAEALLASWSSVPAPIVAVCDPGAAAAGRALGPISGTAKIAPWSDAVGTGRRVRGGSHITDVGAVQPGDRYTLPSVGADAVVDVAVNTSTGARTVRAATPAGVPPRTVTVEGPADARTVVVTGTDGTAARTSVVAPDPVRAAVRVASPTTPGAVIKLQVTATRGAVIIAIPTSRSYEGRRERTMYSRTTIAIAEEGRTTVSVPATRPAERRGVDVVVLGLAQRRLTGVRCMPGAKGPELRCRRDDTGPMAVWSNRHPSWVKGELRGRYDEIVGASFPGLGSDGPINVTEALDELETLPGQTPDSTTTDPGPDPAPPAPVSRHRSAATVAASGTSIESIAGVSASDGRELLADAVYGAIQAGDANGDSKPDFLVGAEVPRLLLSTPAGLSAVDFDTGGDGGSFGSDFDGDGTTEIVDALGSIILGQRSWATTPPKVVSGGDWETGGPGRLPWSHDELGGDPVPLPDVDGDGRFELLDSGLLGVDAVYSGADIPLGGRTRLPVLLQPVAADPLRALGKELSVRSRFSIERSSDVPDEVSTLHVHGATIRLSLDDGLPGQPNGGAGNLLRWQSIELGQPSGLGPVSTPLRVYSRPDLVDVDGPSGDLLIRVATRSCFAQRHPCDQTLRVTRAGAIRAWFDADGYSTSRCAFVDDGPDADPDAEVVCSLRTGKLPSAWTDYDRVGEQGLAVASSELGGAQLVASLPRLSWNGARLRTTSGFSTVRLANGRRLLTAVAISGDGRRATGRIVVFDTIG